MKSKEEALASIVCNVRCINGVRREMYDVFIGRVPSTGKVIRFSHYTKEQTEDHVRKFYAERRNMGDAACQLRPSQIFDAIEAYKMLDDAGKARHLSDVVREWLSGESASGAKIVRAKVEGKQIGEAFDEYVASFDLRQRAHISAIRSRVGNWVAVFGGRRPLSDVESKSVQSYLERHASGSDKTYNNTMNYIRSFMSWCAAPERGYIAENPLALMKPRKIAYVEPEYISVADAEKLMRAFEDEGDAACATFCALSLFCGVRTEEIVRLAEEDVSRTIIIDDGTVRIARPKGYVQGMMPRVFVAMPNAIAWIKKYDGGKAIQGRNIAKIRARITKTCRAIGVNLPHNGGRHSFITYHIAAFCDPARTEAMAGTSAAMRAKHYMGLAKKSEGEAYFAIMPR